MKSSFKDIIQRFRAISSIANSESEAIADLYSENGLGISLGNASSGILLEPHPATGALLGFLNHLPEHLVFSLLALMYSGRDNEENVIGYWSDLKDSFSTKDKAIEKIEEKVPRMEYIDKGISFITESKLDEFSELVNQSLKR